MLLLWPFMPGTDTTAAESYRTCIDANGATLIDGIALDGMAGSRVAVRRVLDFRPCLSS